MQCLLYFWRWLSLANCWARPDEVYEGIMPPMMRITCRNGLYRAERAYRVFAIDWLGRRHQRDPAWVPLRKLHDDYATYYSEPHEHGYVYEHGTQKAAEAEARKVIADLVAERQVVAAIEE